MSLQNIEQTHVQRATCGMSVRHVCVASISIFAAGHDGDCEPSLTEVRMKYKIFFCISFLLYNT